MAFTTIWDSRFETRSVSRVFLCHIVLQNYRVILHQVRSVIKPLSTLLKFLIIVLHHVCSNKLINWPPNQGVSIARRERPKNRKSPKVTDRAPILTLPRKAEVSHLHSPQNSKSPSAQPVSAAQTCTTTTTTATATSSCESRYPSATSPQAWS